MANNKKTVGSAKLDERSKADCEVEQLQGVPVTLDMIMRWEVGVWLELAMGGQDVDDNPEQLLSGKISSLTLEATLFGTRHDRQTIKITLDPQDGKGNYYLYTWNGVLRCGGDPRQVRLIRNGGLR